MMTPARFRVWYMLKTSSSVIILCIILLHSYFPHEQHIEVGATTWQQYSCITRSTSSLTFSSRTVTFAVLHYLAFHADLTTVAAKHLEAQYAHLSHDLCSRCILRQKNITFFCHCSTWSNDRVYNLKLHSTRKKTSTNGRTTASAPNDSESMNCVASFVWP